MEQVTIIRDENNLSLVEWTDGNGIPQRYWVKESALIDRSGKTAKVKNPHQGYPYGVDFVHAIQPSVSSFDICRELRTRGLWTAADLQKNPQAVVGALQAAYGIDMAQVIAIARQYEKTTTEE